MTFPRTCQLTLRGLRRFQNAHNPLLALLQHPPPPQHHHQPPTPLSALLARTMASASAASRLAGKTILITGASSGIGRSTALEFARTAPHSLKLVLTARRVDKLQEVAADIADAVKTAGAGTGAGAGSGAGVQVHTVQLDVADAAAVRGFVAGLPEGFRDIDVLVNNAGVVKGMEKVGQVAEEDVRVMMETNVVGLVNMTQAVLPGMLARGEAGRGDVINVGSIAGREGYPGGSIYCATKAAIRAFTESMRKELIATRVRVMEIDPGQVETEFSLIRFRGDKAKADAVYAGVEPLTPDDIAEIIVFCAGRRENVVVADTLVFPNHQAAATVMHRKS